MLSSNEIARQCYPGIIGDYLLQSERNNGRAVYRSKDKIIKGQQSGFAYLYSFNAEEYAGVENYEKIKDYSGAWLVSFIKPSMNMQLVIFYLDFTRFH